MSKYYLFLAVLVSAFVTRPAAAQDNVILSEIMPANARILSDEDGAFPDWLEVFNAGVMPVNLAGWHLTDNAAALTKWTFPSVTLAPGSFLNVFASAKNRTNDPTHLHTSFQLDADGGYLALVKPDGTNVASAFNPYPQIKEDVAFGLAQKQLTTALLGSSVPQILVPTNADGLPAAWNQLAYVPGGSWTNGLAPPSVGFDTNTPSGGGAPVNVAPGGTAQQSTVNGAFTAALAINNNLADFSHTLGTDTAPFWQVTFTNEVAIHSVVLLNRTSCCGSRLRDITIEILTTNVSGTVTNFTSALLNPENVGFTYPSGPGSISNNLVALNGAPVLGRTVRVRRTTDPDLSGSGGQGNTDEMSVLSLGEVVVNAATSISYHPYFRTDLQARMLGVNASAFVRIPFPLSITPSQLSLGVRYDDGFIAYLNGVEVARRNAPGSPAWDSIATADRAATNGVVQEIINLSSAIPQLVSGTNLLAVQVLNSSAGNGDLLFEPQLTAVGLEVVSNVFLVNATPGTNNNSDYYLDEVADTQFSTNRGFFAAPFSLSITSGTPDAVIYVSFNSDEPGPGKGFLYTNAFTITNTTVVRTRAFKSGWKATDVDTATYLFLSDVIYQAPNWTSTASTPPPYFPATWGANAVNYGMDPEVVSNYTQVQWREALTQIPSISIVTEMPNLFDATTGIYANALEHGELWERPASIELLDPSAEVADQFQENCGLRIRGGFSRNPQFPRHALRVFFRREYGAGKLNYPLFQEEGASEFETFDLRNSSNYAWWRENPAGTNDTFVREVWCRQTLGDMGQPYRRSRYYHLYLNGHYWGISETDERPEASYGQTYFGGSKTNFDVVKCGNRGTDPDFITEATDGNLVAWSNLWVMTRVVWTNAVNSNYFRIIGQNPDGTRNPTLPVMLDVDNLIDYMLGIFYSGDGDATLSSFLGNNMPNNWFGMRDRTNPDVGFRFFNSDCEHTLGANSSQVDRTGPFPNSNEANFAFSNPQWMHEALMRNSEYRVRFGDHVQKHFFNGGALTLGACTNRWWAKAGQITKAIRAYSARWGDVVRAAPYGESDWTNTLKWVANTWFPPRADIVLGQLRGDALFPSNAAPAFSQLGGSVPAGYALEMAHTNGSGAIFFTTDGTDPRLVGGAVSPSAQSYSTPVTINSPMTVRARVLTGSTWSALLEYIFYPAQDFSKLLLTEIMYNPPAAGLVDGDEFEFLELKNSGTTTLNLSGLRFSLGVAYTFPFGTTLAPGTFIVLARNAAQFTNKYPGVTLNGLYTGKLDNSGETLILSHPLGAKVLSVTYDDFAPWPVAPDNYGFSLVPVRPNANPDPDHSANWRASTFPGGSPGADDPASLIPPVLISEVLSHSETAIDFIELFNPNTNAVDIGGWFLSDDPGTPQKFRIPDGTSLEPFTYLVFDETQFNPTPGTNNSFSLRARGDEVYLFSGDASTNLTGYSHGFTFGAAADGDTFGRYVISTGEEQFPAQLAPTPGQPNAGPRVGPVVFNEIQYHPDAGGDEFVELKNITTNGVPLYDTDRTTNTWRLNGLDYYFPTNLVLASNEIILIVATNPAIFRAKYSIPTNILILGPYAGSLQDSGERLELQRPDVPDTNGLAYITVDEVRYNDRAPWPPAADGSGASLQRKNSAAYGNDPANWEAAVPTPGAEYLGGETPVIVTQPQSQVGNLGQTVTFTLGATGSAPLNYQWRYNGLPIAGVITSNLVLTNVQFAQAGSYSALVFNHAGSAASAVATLTVIRPPVILTHPLNQWPRPGSNAVFTVSATGSGLLRYQWRFNGTNLAGQTGPTLTIANAGFQNAGAYSVLVTDSSGSILSLPATLLIGIDPIIMQNPLSQMVVAGGTVTLSVTVTNTATLPMGYRLRRNNATLSPTIPGAFLTLNERTAYFTLTGTNVAPPWTNYAIICTNAVRINGNLSTSAILTYVTDGDGDTLPDFWETQYFNSATGADGFADADLDGRLNWQEYVAGTDPTNALSYLKIDTFSVSNSATLTFGAISNKTYTLQYSDLLGGPWSRFTDVPARATNHTELLVDPSYTTNRFYRLATPQQP